MADASGMGYVSQSLQALLRATIMNSGPFPGTDIDLRSPKEIWAAGNNPTVVSLWLHRVRRLDELVNAPPQFRPDGRVIQRPLPLNLYYLVTPIAPSALTKQRLLGLAMQTFHDHARVGAEFLRAELLLDPPGSISIHLEPQTLEETTRIWHALHEPYDLSVAYMVQYVPIASATSRPEAPRVVDKVDRFATIERVD
jgi:hypothetical protein